VYFTFGFSLSRSNVIIATCFLMHGVIMTERSKPLSVTLVREHARLFAMLLALTTGVLLISNLWEQTLTQNAMASAGRGVIFILLALGLLGTRRLSLALTVLLCGTTTMSLLYVDRTVVLTDWLEPAMFLIRSGLLFTSISHPAKVRNAEAE